jgi:hypothetical protein
LSVNQEAEKQRSREASDARAEGKGEKQTTNNKQQITNQLLLFIVK